MKYKILLFLSFLLATGMSCQKTKTNPTPGTFNVIDAMAGSNPIVPKFGADTLLRYYSQSSISPMIILNYGTSQLYSVQAGNTLLSVVPFTDTVFTIFNGNIDVMTGGIYSLFLSGDTAHADTLLVKDNIPSYNDSSTGVRFVNLTIDSKSPLTINLAGDSGNLQFPPLGYRQITDFKKYDARGSVGGYGSYQFEIRDQASGSLLTTFNWSYFLYNNNTIVIAGSTDPSSPTPLNVFAVNNY